MKQLIALTLILLSAGAYLYLDCRTRMENESAEQMSRSVQQTRLEGQRRAQSKDLLDKQAAVTVNICIEAAAKARADYMALVEQVAPQKRGQPVVAPAIVNAADEILAKAQAACKSAPAAAASAVPASTPAK